MTTERITFPGHDGHDLAASLDLPDGPVRATALFAHCFTCSKDILPARRIAARLTGAGIAVLRFDFTGWAPAKVPSRTRPSPRTWKTSLPPAAT